MKIELMKIVVRGLELLNVKLEAKKHRCSGYNDYYGDLAAKVCWNDWKGDESLFIFSPYLMHLRDDARPWSDLRCSVFTCEGSRFFYCITNKDN